MRKKIFGKQCSNHIKFPFLSYTSCFIQLKPQIESPRNDRMLHYLAAASVGYLQNYCYGIGTRVAFEPPKETSSRSFPNLHLASLVKNSNIYSWHRTFLSLGWIL